jgi:hypothetical protein
MPGVLIILWPSLVTTGIEHTHGRSSVRSSSCPGGTPPPRWRQHLSLRRVGARGVGAPATTITSWSRGSGPGPTKDEMPAEWQLAKREATSLLRAGPASTGGPCVRSLASPAQGMPARARSKRRLVQSLGLTPANITASIATSSIGW